ncbi:peroxisomal-enoyl-isomerase [Niveomyces insectorum RCEF 264]|uniref:Peroxisomal-enoyl-isomerase n=1 Tax=Niveomyces insectorum RCEF 264 TaxID=1081102 RepID=A0A167PG80_9HYPO|nr:peroxisomal-enoyl-isomerase [Niveomyces insectorum RCEF 264]
MAPPPDPTDVIRVAYDGRVATITLDNAAKLNALSLQQYYDLACKLQEVARRDDVYVTFLTGTGRFFSAYVFVLVLTARLFLAALVKLLVLAPCSLSARSPSQMALRPSAVILFLFTRVSSTRRFPANPVTLHSGADVSLAQNSPAGHDRAAHLHWLRSFVANNLNIARAFYTHPKILVVGLNGPVVGLSAALVAFADFVYCTPSTFLLTPFSSLGLVAEGAASLGLIQRLGRAKANEALLMSKRIGSDELLATGFVNAVFDVGHDNNHDHTAFHARVRREIDERLGAHLVGDSLLGIKRLVRGADADRLDLQNVHEVFAGLDRFMTGVPQEEFRKLAAGEKRHKL